jgi:hypothetical protein
MTETADGLAVERSAMGRRKAAARRAVLAGVGGGLLLLALTSVDAWMNPHLWELTLGFAVVGGVLSAAVFGVLGLLSRARWELDTGRGVARWRVKTTLGAEAEAELSLTEVVGVEVTPAQGWAREHQLRITFRDGQGESIAAGADPQPLAAIRDAIRARLPNQKSL